jgi:hypothetical protein
LGFGFLIKAPGMMNFCPMTNWPEDKLFISYRDFSVIPCICAILDKELPSLTM